MVVASRSTKAQTKGTRADEAAALLPETRTELWLFILFSLVIGAAWEVLFRGYLIWVLEPRLTTFGAVTAAAGGLRPRPWLQDAAPVLRQPSSGSAVHHSLYPHAQPVVAHADPHRRALDRRSGAPPQRAHEGRGVSLAPKRHARLTVRSDPPIQRPPRFGGGLLRGSSSVG